MVTKTMLQICNAAAVMLQKPKLCKKFTTILNLMFISVRNLKSIRHCTTALALITVIEELPQICNLFIRYSLIHHLQYRKKNTETIQNTRSVLLLQQIFCTSFPFLTTEGELNSSSDFQY